MKKKWYMWYNIKLKCCFTYLEHLVADSCDRDPPGVRRREKLLHGNPGRATGGNVTWCYCLSVQTLQSRWECCQAIRVELLHGNPGRAVACGGIPASNWFPGNVFFYSTIKESISKELSQEIVFWRLEFHLWQTRPQNRSKFFFPQKFCGNPAGIPRKSIVILMGIQGCLLFVFLLQNNSLVNVLCNRKYFLFVKLKLSVFIFP